MGENAFTLTKFKQILEEACGKKPLPKKINACLNLAFEGHAGQLRESQKVGERIPYIVHPVGVARLACLHYPLVKSYLADNLEEITCAALTHDLLEDTRTNGRDIEKVAGSRVRHLTEALTKFPTKLRTTKSERQSEFMRRIVVAGPTAVYLRICDSLHNLSRPQSSPSILYKKAITKAREQYLPLLTKVSLGKEFTKIYTDAIAAGESFLAAHPKPEAKEVYTLEQATAYCAQLVQGKVVEVHDLPKIFLDLTLPTHVAAWQCSAKNLDSFALIETAGDAKSLTETFQKKGLSYATSLNDSDLIKKMGLPTNTCLYWLPIMINPSKVFTLSLAYIQPNKPPAWLSLTIAKLLTDILSQKMIVAEADHRTTLANTAAILGINFDVDVASEIMVEPTDLINLEHWRNRAEQAVATMRYILELCLSSEFREHPLRDLIKIDARVKTVDSILKKYVAPTKRVWPQYETLEDIAGVRIICPTLSMVYELEEFLLSDRAKREGIRLNTAITEARRDYISKPTTRGYRALHLIFEIETYIKGSGIRYVPCELQMRTMAQDVWANISHRTIYRNDTDTEKLHRKLRLVGKALEELEHATEEIIGDEKKPPIIN